MPDSATHTTLNARQTVGDEQPCAPPGSAARVPVPWAALMAQRDYLVRFAQRKLHDPALAEDAVHDVFEAVLSGRATFEGRAALRSWLTAILKNKVVDVIRQRARFDSLEGDGDADGDAEVGPQAQPAACNHAGPEEIASHRELLAHTLSRITQLPKGLRDVMQFRVLQDEPSGVVCRRLGISEASLFVRLHRARKQLLGCEAHAPADRKRGYPSGLSKSSFGACL